MSESDKANQPVRACSQEVEGTSESTQSRSADPLSFDGPRHQPCKLAPIEIRNLSVTIHNRLVLDRVSLSIAMNCVTAIIGPTGTGKSTLLRCFNRRNDVIEGVRTQGQVLIDGRDINDAATDIPQLRRRVAHVDDSWTAFPTTVFENVAFGPRMAGVRSPNQLQEAVKSGLQRAGLWDEIGAQLDERAARLSSGQQYQLCIARALAMQPDVLLLDEPALALDPGATARVEDLIFELKSDVTIVTVTNNVEQAARISDYTAFLLNGRLVEAGSTTDVFTNPGDYRTEDYIRGRFG